MDLIFHCPVCNAPLGTLEAPYPKPLPPCPHCGWRSVESRTRFQISSWMPSAFLAALGGLASGALIAHGQLVALFLFLALGPLAGAKIGRLPGRSWWIRILAYSTCQGIGIYLWPDSLTFQVTDWRNAATATVITGVSGVLAGLLSHPA